MSDYRRAPNAGPSSQAPRPQSQFYAQNNFDVQAQNFATNPGSVMVSTGIQFMKTHYVFSLTWLCGLLIAAFANGYRVDANTERKFQQALYNADEIEQSQVNVAYQDMDGAYNRYYASKGWFSCDSSCSVNYNRYLQQKDELNRVKKIHSAAISKARQVVGVFSMYGVSDARRLFWSSWTWGKNFAKRISFYDAMFMAMDSRNDSISVYIGRLVIRILMNFTIGFVAALVSFVWQLFWFVRTYGGGFAGFIFFFCGAMAAFSLIVTAIIAMYATAAGTAVVVMNMAGNQSLQGRRRRNQRLHYS